MVYQREERARECERLAFDIPLIFLLFFAHFVWNAFVKKGKNDQSTHCLSWLMNGGRLLPYRDVRIVRRVRGYARESANGARARGVRHITVHRLAWNLDSNLFDQ